METSVETMMNKKTADITSTKANCMLLSVRGKYYYAEEFGTFIQIDQREYDRILNFPYLGCFTTAWKKHVQWRQAKREGTTLTVGEAMGAALTTAQNL
jgi:hypothetical protein